MNTRINTPRPTPDYQVGLHLTRRGETLTIVVLSFLFSLFLTWVYLLGPAPAAPPHLVPPPAGIHNCLLTHNCDSSWTQVTQTLGDSLAESTNSDGGDRVWESCMLQRSSGTIVCPWGITYPHML